METVGQLSELVRKRREEIKITQCKLAEYAGLSNSYINDIEMGRRTPKTQGVIDSLSEVLGVPSEYLWIAAGKIPPEVMSHAPFKTKHIDKALMCLRTIT